MTVVDEIKSRINIVEYIGRYTMLRRAGRTYKCNCLFHQERTPSMVVNEERQSWKCFGCGKGGDVFTFVELYHGWTFTEALNELGKIAGVEVAQRTPEQRSQDEQLDRLRGLLTTMADSFHTLLYDSAREDAASALAYVRERRRLNDETIRTFGIGFAPDGWRNATDYLLELGYSEDDLVTAGVAVRSDKGRLYDRFRHRLMIPIRDERGRVIGFGARALKPDDNPKYLNSPQTPLFDKSRTLFGLDVAKNAIRDSESAVIVEGYMDAIQAHQAGYTNVVAQMGTAMTEAQLKLIAPRWAKRIVLALDADAAGQNATLRGLEVARETLAADYGGRLAVDIRILGIPDAKDPDDLIRESPDRWGELVVSAMPVAEFVIRVETATLAPDASLIEREAVARRVLPMLVASESDLYRKDNVQKLAVRLRIAERDLLQWADGQAKALSAARPAAPTSPPPLSDGAPPPADGSPAVAVVRPPSSRDTALEAYCLRLLLQSPDLFYVVNRRLRALADGEATLLDGYLGDLCADDFSRSEYRAIMDVLKSGLEQVDLEPLDYVFAHVDARLRGEVETLLRDEVDGLRERLRQRLLADLNASMKQSGRLAQPVDPQSEVLDRALRLRVQRLQRDLQEMCFLLMDSQSSGDETTVATLNAHVWLSGEAKRLIEADLQRQTGLLRQSAT